MNVLILNAGSSSLKASVFSQAAVSVPHPSKPLAHALLEMPHGKQTATLTVETSSARKKFDLSPGRSRGEYTEQALERLWHHSGEHFGEPSALEFVGHRVVHGGDKLTGPLVLDHRSVTQLESCIPLAPLHLPPALEVIEAARRFSGDGVRHIAVFDTAFHRTLPPEASVYPVPYEWFEAGIRRYGFHGINHQYCAHRAAALMAQPLESLRLVTCHLGSGCSIAAVDRGRSVDTSMGFTPLDGIVMGTRPGALDPGILLYRLRHGDSVEALESALQRNSGLLGISGSSGDMRDLEQAAHKGDARAELAITVFVRQLAKSIAGAITVLGGLDALVFTAGIGEHSERIRQEVCAWLAPFRLRLDTAKNAAVDGDCRIESSESAVAVLVVPANEEWQICRDCSEFLARKGVEGSGTSGPEN